MKKSVLIGMLAIVMLSITDLMAQRNGRKSNNNDRNASKEVKYKKSKNNRKNRNVRVTDRRTVSYGGYYGSSYDRFNDRGTYRRVNSRKVYRPSSRHVWIEGQWKYDRRLRRDVWFDGYWVKRQNRSKWVPGHYTRYGNRSIWVAGYWITI